MKTTMKIVIPSKITGTAFRHLTFNKHHAAPHSHLPAQFYETKTVGIHLGSSKAVGGFPQIRSTSVVLHDVFQGPPWYGGSCGPGTDGEIGRLRAKLEKTRGRVGGGDSGNSDREEDVAESATSARTRNGKPSAAISVPGRISCSSSSHTHTQ